MLPVYPDDHPRSQCLADRCRHTCCAVRETECSGDDPDTLFDELCCRDGEA